ncbi:hypothetical protein CRD60_05340 [Bifidobacterium aemilianum]|uniref:DUF8094 domain-containing protein n=2 Tax=Bifidobacterium aemilianum TaxID=2493120 RepID=A0A366K9D1_9BIFI|nr:hypothetical protein [Bifidobacterium aemilianum]RBP97733.1 hypothetical protein CRD60_05340 [Bifidobacterium aemilianum]
MGKARGFTRMVASALTVLAAISLAACEGQVPKPDMTNDEASTGQVKEQPDLTEAQEKRIRTGILETLDKANEAKDPSGLAGRVTGPALDVRTSELNIAKATDKLDPKTTIPKEMTQVVIPTDASWPRSVFTITTTTEDQQSKRLLVMTQESAHSNYQLWAVTRLFQGAKLPKFAVPRIGSQMGKPQDKGLVATPQEAVDRYADLLQSGDASKYADSFASDFFRQDLNKLSQTVQEGMERNKGTQTQTFTPVKDRIAVMRSSDGGDLVVAQINSEWTRQAGEGRDSKPASDAEKALFGDGQVTSTMKVTYVNVLAFYVPPAGSGQQIAAVGAERQPIKVEAL